MNRVVHFEIHADNPKRAAKFYKKVFGWKIEKWKGPVDYWLIDTGKGIGINGAIKKRTKTAIGSIIAYVCTIDVPSIDNYAKRVADNGGMVIMQKRAIPKVGWHAYCKDTEGNIFGVMQDDIKVK